MLPYPPTINHYYGVRGRGGAKYIKPKGKTFRIEVMIELRAGRELYKEFPMSGNIELTIDVFPPDRRKRDLDNLLKALFDALEHGKAYHNDNQICKFTMERHEVVKGGRVEVVINERQVDRRG